MPGPQRVRQDARQQRNRIDNRGATYSNVGNVYNGTVQQTVVHDDSVTYTVDEEDTAFLEGLSRFVIGLLGVERTQWLGLGSGALAVLAFVVFVESAALATVAVWSGVLSALVAAACLAALAFRSQSQCPSCNTPYALRESAAPVVREVETGQGLRRTTTRYYRCASCGHETERRRNELVEPDEDE